MHNVRAWGCRVLSSFALVGLGGAIGKQRPSVAVAALIAAAVFFVVEAVLVRKDA